MSRSNVSNVRDTYLQLRNTYIVIFATLAQSDSLPEHAMSIVHKAILSVMSDSARSSSALSNVVSCSGSQSHVGSA